MSEPQPNDPEGSDDSGWDSGWEQHRQRQMIRFAKLPFASKLRWLEEAETIAMNLAASRKAQRERSPKSQA